ncbi:MAG: hypothetical protein Q8L89_03545 [Gammaproteobacteria bacterium]|nr:hypothetical protein [Gammaproteobacteria bacterium]
MHALEVIVLRIYLPDDKEHLDRVLSAIESFHPGGDVIVHELNPAFDRNGYRIKVGTERMLMVEYTEESCRAKIFVDAFHDVIKPGRIIGSSVYMCAGEEEEEGEEPTEANGEKES